MVSHYVDDPREALRLMEQPVTGRYPHWCEEGYAEYEEIDEWHSDYRGISGTLVTRRTTGSVSLQTLRARAAQLDYLEQLAKVRQMIVDIRGVQGNR